MILLFKTPERQREYALLDPRVLEIVEWVAEYVWARWRDVLVVTEVWRDDPTSPHSYFRAVDLDVLVRGDSEDVRQRVNARYP